MTSELTEHHEANAALVQQRIGMGDHPASPRPLDHLAVVPRRRAAAVQSDLEAAGFRVDGVQRGLRRARIEFSRIDAADLDTADAFTREIVEIVGRHGGGYDGWAGYLVAGPAGG
ncbi:MAG: hypothetical protein F2825_05195 [Actinobacteria bacterium]|uniref:Unannotated protein n=1 Tax=freshwater metagenome TaxID=449393 RepID=A0A6J7H0W5_9ZZZZ|nr:hypothetical protein [Actinomycetota bacterium]